MSFVIVCLSLQLPLMVSCKLMYQVVTNPGSTPHFRPVLVYMCSRAVLLRRGHQSTKLAFPRASFCK